MTSLPTHQRYSRIFQHQEADHVPMLGAPWSSTLER